MNHRMRNERYENMARKHLSRKLAGMIAASAIIAAPTGIGATAVVSAETTDQGGAPAPSGVVPTDAPGVDNSANSVVPFAAPGAEEQVDPDKPTDDPHSVKHGELINELNHKLKVEELEKGDEEIVVEVTGATEGDWVAFSYFRDKEKHAAKDGNPKQHFLKEKDDAGKDIPNGKVEWYQIDAEGNVHLPKEALPTDEGITLVAQGKDSTDEDKKVVGWAEMTIEEPKETTASSTSTTTTESDGSVPDGTIEGTGKALMKMFGAIATFGQDTNSTGSTNTTGNSTKSSKSTSTKSSTSKKSSNSTSNNSNSKEPQTSRSRTTSYGSTSGGSGSKSTSSGSKSSGSGSKSSKSSKSSGKSGKSTKSTKAKSTKSNKAKKSGSKPEKAAKNPVKTTDELKSANAHGVKGALEDDRLLLTVPEAKAGDWLYVYVFSDDKAPKGLGWMKVDKNKQISIDTSDLGPGVHKFALVNEDDKLVGWNGVQFPDEPGNGASEENVAPQAQSEVMMAASDWSLIAGSLGIVALSALGAFVWWRTRNLG